MRQKFPRGGSRRSFAIRASRKQSAVVIRTADEDFFPRLGMSRGQPVEIGEFVNLRRRQGREGMAGDIVQQVVAQAVETLEMLEEQQEPLDVRSTETLVRIEKGMGH